MIEEETPMQKEEDVSAKKISTLTCRRCKTKFTCHDKMPVQKDPGRVYVEAELDKMPRLVLHYGVGTRDFISCPKCRNRIHV